MGIWIIGFSVSLYMQVKEAWQLWPAERDDGWVIDAIVKSILWPYYAIKAAYVYLRDDNDDN